MIYQGLVLIIKISLEQCQIPDNMPGVYSFLWGTVLRVHNVNVGVDSTSETILETLIYTSLWLILFLSQHSQFWPVKIKLMKEQMKTWVFAEMLSVWFPMPRVILFKLPLCTRNIPNQTPHCESKIECLNIRPSNNPKFTYLPQISWGQLKSFLSNWLIPQFHHSALGEFIHSFLDYLFFAVILIIRIESNKWNGKWLKDISSDVC